jgi:hypothetical protein
VPFLLMAPMSVKHEKDCNPFPVPQPKHSKPARVESGKVLGRR